MYILNVCISKYQRKFSCYFPLFIAPSPNFEITLKVDFIGANMKVGWFSLMVVSSLLSSSTTFYFA